MRKAKKTSTVLCILDGFGLREKERGNAVSLARTPNIDRLLSNYPHSTLKTFGKEVGLPENQMGNSEVGHMNIGSGRVILQSLPRIDRAFTDNKISQIDEFKSFFKKSINSSDTLYFLNLKLSEASRLR